MSFSISKILGFALTDPALHWLALMGVGFWGLLRRRRAAWIGFGAAFVYMSIVLFSPLPRWLVASLESQFAPQPNPDPAVNWVVVLLGGTVYYHKDLDQFLTSHRADRPIEALRLMRKLPNASLLISGNTTFELSPGVEKEAHSVRRWALGSGLPPERIVVEEDSLTTAENARLSARILATRGVRRFYLVTSAFHLHRAMGHFKDEGLDPIPYPVDFLVEHQSAPAVRGRALSNLQLWVLYWHEFFGEMAAGLKRAF